MANWSLSFLLFHPLFVPVVSVEKVPTLWFLFPQSSALPCSSVFPMFFQFHLRPLCVRLCPAPLSPLCFVPLSSALIPVLFPSVCISRSSVFLSFVSVLSLLRRDGCCCYGRCMITVRKGSEGWCLLGAHGENGDWFGRRWW